ncbi:MAG: cytochrome c family protein [Alphaproteobacteria bacterium]|nr:cytochrome c family protein [Alphaproteobacteria bacterium]
MDSFEWNKIFMGLGFSALAVLGIKELTNAVYAVEKPEQPGYVVAGVEATGGGAETGGEAAAAALPDFGTVLAAADVAAGEKVFAKCTQCHTAEKGGPNKIGPNLYGVVGNHHAHLGDAFAYSAAMKALSGETWDYAHLYQFLESPGKVVKGTKMAFAGLKKSEDRLNVIAYLRTQADTPFPLPAPAPAGAAPAAPAEGTTPATPAEGAAPAPAGETPPATPPAAGEPAPSPAEPAAAPAPAPVAPPPPERVDGTSPSTDPATGSGSAQPETPPPPPPAGGH